MLVFKFASKLKVEPPPELPPYNAVGVSNNPFDLTPAIWTLTEVDGAVTLKLPAVPEVRVIQSPFVSTPVKSGVIVTPFTS